MTPWSPLSTHIIDQVENSSSNVHMGSSSILQERQVADTQPCPRRKQFFLESPIAEQILGLCSADAALWAAGREEASWRAASSFPT